jgi:hypothetical protein
MQLLSPQDPNLYQRDLLLAADCTLFSIKDFHGTVLQGKRLAIACPKLDDAETLYLEKLVAMIDFSEIASLSVVAMELPCCNDLAGLVQKAMAMAERKISGDIFIVKMNGEINKSKILA